MTSRETPPAPDRHPVACQPASAAKPPNIVLIISDDQSWTDYMGAEAIETPNIDRLAKQSRLFKRGYAKQPLLPVAGLHDHRTVPAPDQDYRQRTAHATGGRNSEQYRNRCRNAFHLSTTSPPCHGRWPSAVTSATSPANGGRATTHGGFTHGMTHGDPKRGGRHGDVGLKIGREGMDEIFDFIDAGDKPFFVWYAPFLPHTPHNPPKRLLDKYAKKTSPSLSPVTGPCASVDETCGQIRSSRREKTADDTIVLYVTDNGWIQRADNGWGVSRSKRSIRRRPPHPDHGSLARQSETGGSPRVGQQH